VAGDFEIAEEAIDAAEGNDKLLLFERPDGCLVDRDSLPIMADVTRRACS